MFIIIRYSCPKQIKLILSNWEALYALETQIAMIPVYIILMIKVSWFGTILFTRNKTGLYEILSKTRVVSADPQKK